MCLDTKHLLKVYMAGRLPRGKPFCEVKSVVTDTIMARQKGESYRVLINCMLEEMKRGLGRSDKRLSRLLETHFMWYPLHTIILYE